MSVKNKWEASFLKEMSLKTDPLADDLIKNIIKNKGFGELRMLFKTLNDNDDKAGSASTNTAVVNYFNAELTLPIWADQDKIALAEQMFLKNGPEISLLLNFKALPLCYTSKGGAKILALSGRMTEQGDNTEKLTRRLMETAQMVINVMSPGGFDPKGKGIITIKKVRLYHAAIRSFILNQQANKEGWDVEQFGAPINQEELAGTQMAFSALTIKGLEQLGCDLTVEEKDAYIHCWNIVGHFLGIDPQLYPENYEEGFSLGLAILKRNCGSSADGKLLTKSLIDFSANFIPGKLFDGIPVHFIDLFIEDIGKDIDMNLNEVLGIPDKRNWWLKLLISIFDFLDKLTGLTKITDKLFPRLNLRILQGMINHYLKTTKTEFYIPESLKQNWNLK